jgi:LacI family transcriptional regulator
MVIADITNPFFAQMVRGAEDAVLKRNYVLLTFNTDDHVEREKYVFSVLRSQRVDGILLVVAPGPRRPAHVLDMMKSGTPIVCLDRVPPGVKVDSVTVGNFAATRECVRHLIELGHRRIGIVAGSLNLQTGRERLNGYLAALREARIKVAPELIRKGDFHMESGYRLGLELLLSRHRPTALFVSNNLMTIGVMKALAESRLRCPQDVALATFDDMPFTQVLQPPLTAVAQPAYTIGQTGADLLVDRIESKVNDARPMAIRLEGDLKIRESTTGRRRPLNRTNISSHRRNPDTAAREASPWASTPTAAVKP